MFLYDGLQCVHKQIDIPRVFLCRLSSNSNKILRDIMNILEPLFSAVEFRLNWASSHDLEHDMQVGDYIFLSRISRIDFSQFTGLFSM
jgi:hypothetical protein